MILANGPRLSIPTPGVLAGEEPPSLRLTDAERDRLRTVLEMTGWRVRGKGGAAEILGLKPTTLDSKMARLRLTRKAEGKAV